MESFANEKILFVLASSGFILLFYILLQCIWYIQRIMKLYITSKNKLKPHKYGKWSVITGCTSGIGLHLSEELAKRGSNLVLIGRNSEILENLKKEYENQYKIDVIIIIIDFNRNDYNEEIECKIKELDIGILVNNVGSTFENMPNFLDITQEKLLQVINTNIVSTIMLTKIVLPIMMNKKRGIIINIGSAFSYMSVKYSGIYPATKKFIDHFTKCLISEYPFGQYGIYFNCIHPCFVSTKMSKVKPSFTCPTAQNYAQSTIDTFEYTGISHGYLIHDIICFIIELLPSFISNKLINDAIDKIRYKIQLKQSADKNQ